MKTTFVGVEAASGSSQRTIAIVAKQNVAPPPPSGEHVN